MTLKKEIEDILHPDKEELHPPRAPIIGETSSVDRNRRVVGIDTNGQSSADTTRAVEKQRSADSKPIIDFSYLTNNSSFQRAIMEFIKKFIPGFENVEARGSKEVMVKSFDINAQNYRECMKELKEKLAKVRVK